LAFLVVGMLLILAGGDPQVAELRMVALRESDLTVVSSATGAEVGQ
jgi:hypothetical protein